MAYIKEKFINGSGPYLYLQESYREGDKVKTRHLKYLGKNTGQHNPKHKGDNNPSGSDGKADEESEKRMGEAMKHPDKLGAGAKKRENLSSDEKFEVVMREYERGTLYSGSGKKVTSRKQAIAIAHSEAGTAREQ
jgi:hypothetical protein